MNKSRWILTLATGAVVAALGIGAVAYVASPGVEAQSPGLPATMEWMPAGASVVGHVDLTSLFNSPFRDAWTRALEAQDADGDLAEFQETTGLDPLTDLYRMSFALVTSDDLGATDRDASKPSMRPTPESWGVSVQGAFDSQSLLAKLEQFADIEVEQYQGTTIYHPVRRWANENEADDEKTTDAVHEEPAFAFAGGDTLLMGDRNYIRRMLDTGQGRAASAVDAINQNWGEGTFLNDTFWISAAPEKGFGAMLPAGGEIPPIQSLALSGRLDTDIALRARGLAANLDSATKLADVVRGFVALGGLQQGANPDIRTVLDSVQIDQFENAVELSLSVPYDTLERLSERADPHPEAEDN